MRSVHFVVRASRVLYDGCYLSLTGSACVSLLWMKWMPYSPHPWKVASFILRFGGLLSTWHCHSTSVLWKILMEGGQILTLINFPRRLFQRTQRRRFWSTAVDWRGKSWVRSSGCSKPGRKWREWDELDDENLPLFYTRPSFQWASGNNVPPEQSTRTKSEHWPGPVRVLDGSRTALFHYFQLFYSDTVLNKLVQFTNDNATKKKNNNKKQRNQRITKASGKHWLTSFLYTKVYNIPSVQQWGLSVCTVDISTPTFGFSPSSKPRNEENRRFQKAMNTGKW